MFRELICKIYIILCAMSANAQNLVPNPGFEEILGCPESHSLIENAFPWKPGNDGSPDLFNRCATTPHFTIPFVGILSDSYQEPRNGNGMCGMYNYTKPDDNGIGEYIISPLKEELVKGKTYYLEFYVAIDYSENDRMTFTDAIGMAFLDKELMIPLEEFDPLSLSPAIKNGNGLLTEDDKWYKVSGCYEAKGGESFLLIGVFTPYDEIEVLKTNYFFSPDENYKFIDDVGIFLLDPLDDMVELCDNNDIVIGIEYKDSAFKWNTGDTSATIRVNEPGIYSVEISRGDCVFTDETIVIRNCEGDVYIPNIWSPNNDGINDKLILGVGQDGLIDNLHFSLYDRYGNKIVDQRNDLNIITPESMEVGVYTFLISYDFNLSGKKIKKKKSGSVTLVK